MKKLLLIAVLALIKVSCIAQSCGNSGSGICTSNLNPLTSPDGLYPSNSDQIPCATRGVAYSEVVQLVFPTAAQPEGLSSTYGVNSWVIDSIQNLPCGLCWATNKANNFFFPLTDAACIKFSGTTNDIPGQYKLRIKFHINSSSGITFDNQNADHFGWEIYLRVNEQGVFCPVVNTGLPGLTASPTTGSISTPTVSPAGPVTLCTGGNITLTSSGGYSAYLWSTGATTQSINVTQAGNYSVKVFKNCNDATSATVQVIAAQGNALIVTPASADTFCIGGNVTLNATGGFTDYLWSGGQTTSSITVNQTGNYSVSAIDPSVSCNTNSNVVHVEVLPANFNVPISSSQPNGICEGTSANLSAGSGYTSYLWSTGATTSAISINSPDNYTVTVTHPNGGCTGMGGLNVLSLPLPDGDIVINDTFSDSIVCDGETIELLYTELDMGTVSFQWRRNGVAIPNADGPTYDATQDGYYNCEMEKTGGCTVISTGYTLTFLPLPTVTYQFPTNTICDNSAVVALTGGQPAGGYYMIDGNILTTTLDPSTLSIGTHEVAYYYTGNNNCTGSDGSNVVIDNCSGINEVINNIIHIYPTPTSNTLTIETVSGKGIYHLQDVTGKLLLSGNVTATKFTLDISTLSKGIYLLSLFDGEHEVNRKIVKE